MKIFIDESGAFIPNPSNPTWSSVGALAVPDESLMRLKEALSELKEAFKLNDNEELKNRPDSSSTAFIKFLDTIYTLNCSLHIVSTKSSSRGLDGVNNHKKSLQNALYNYSEKEPHSLNAVNDTISLIDKLSGQLFTQCLLQSYMISYSLDKILALYSQLSPKSLAKFSWIVDRKNITETNYDKAFKNLYVGTAIVKSLSEPSPMVLTPRHNYHYFLQSYSYNQHHDPQSYAKRFEKNIDQIKEALYAVDLRKILAEDFTLADSKEEYGLQAIDLLISSTNRCLKGNFTNNSLIAQKIGRLTVNSPQEKFKSITLLSVSSEQNITDREDGIIKIFDQYSRKLFSDISRKNYSQKVTLHS